MRLFLWNSFGKETIEFKVDEIVYEADYKWFKDGKKLKSISNPSYSIQRIGYESENLGVLVIQEEELRIESVVKMTISELEKLIETLTKNN